MRAISEAARTLKKIPANARDKVSAEEKILFLGLVTWSGMCAGFPSVALVSAVPSSPLLKLLGVL